MRNEHETISRRIRCAIAAARYMHAKPTAAGGKKEQAMHRAEAAATGRYAPSAPPLRLLKQATE